MKGISAARRGLSEASNRLCDAVNELDGIREDAVLSSSRYDML